MNKVIKTSQLALLAMISSISNAGNLSISVDLLSYEQKKDYCSLTYSVTNNSWGTMYGLRITTEAFDDRGSRLDGYAFGSTMNPFAAFWNPLVSIPSGSETTSSDLKYKGQCKYMGSINALEVPVNDCNIRMMPEEANCIDIIEFKSSIDHITLTRK